MGFGPRMAHLIRNPGYGSPKYRSVVDHKKIQVCLNVVGFFQKALLLLVVASLPLSVDLPLSSRGIATLSSPTRLELSFGDQNYRRRSTLLLTSLIFSPPSPPVLELTATPFRFCRRPPAPGLCFSVVVAIQPSSNPLRASVLLSDAICQLFMKFTAESLVALSCESMLPDPSFWDLQKLGHN